MDGIARKSSVPLIRRPHPLVFFMLLPSLALIIVFNYIPIVQSFYYSFFQWSGGANKVFLGLGNYATLLKDQIFIKSMVNQAYILLFRVAFMVVPPLLVAELIFWLKNRAKLSNIFRMLFVIPVVVPPVVVLLLWQFIYDGEIGFLNALLKTLGRADLVRGWLADPDTALASVIAMGFPWIDGTNVLIFLAGLLAVDMDLWDSVSMDGVKPLKRFFLIDLHLISGQLRLILTLTTIRLMQDFVGVMVLTNGGPGYETTVPGLLLYKNAFSYGKMGYANAIGVVMFILIFSLSVLNNKFKSKEEN
jgi:raffinose/stachyose/melibiose transport system permease protein